jgi:hypothetical protein
VADLIQVASAIEWYLGYSCAGGRGNRCAIETDPSQVCCARSREDRIAERHRIKRRLVEVVVKRKCHSSRARCCTVKDECHAVMTRGGGR